MLLYVVAKCVRSEVFGVKVKEKDRRTTAGFSSTMSTEGYKVIIMRNCKTESMTSKHKDMEKTACSLDGNSKPP